MQIIVKIYVIILLFAVGCSGGGSGNPTNVISSPSIASISPSFGGSGTTVNIQGNRFGLVQGTSILSYAGVTINPSSWSDSQISVVMPSNAPPDGVFVVTVNGIPSNSSVPFTISRPVISYISPSSAAVNEQVNITGQYFGERTGASYVTFNSLPADIISWTNAIIVCRVPDMSSTSNSIAVVVWIDANRYSASSNFTLKFPAISSVHPSIDNIGAPITIVGQNFGANQILVNGSVTVSGFAASVLAWSDNSIQIRIPQGAVSGSNTINVFVNGRSVTSSVSVSAPMVNSFFPASNVAKGNLLTVFGSFLSAEQDVVNRSVSIDTIGPVAGVNWNDTSLSFVWPVENVVFTQQRTVTVTVGGLSTQFTIVAE